MVVLPITSNDTEIYIYSRGKHLAFFKNKETGVWEQANTEIFAPFRYNEETNRWEDPADNVT